MSLISKLSFILILFYLISVASCAFGGGIKSHTSVDWTNVHSTLDHTLAKDAQTRDPFDPIDKTYIFSIADAKAISWLRFGLVYGAHQIEWKWYSPEGMLRFYDSYQIDDPNKGSEEHWGNFTAASQLPIKGILLENATGSWHVDVIQDGQRIYTENFELISAQLSDSNLDRADSLNPPLNIQFQTDAVDASNKCVYYTSDSQGHQLYKIRVYAIGPDLGEIGSVKYILHETFENPEYTATDASNNFEMVLWTWGRFNMPIIVTTKEGIKYNYTYPFTFRNKLVDAQNKGYRFISVNKS